MSYWIPSGSPLFIFYVLSILSFMVSFRGLAGFLITHALSCVWSIFCAVCCLASFLSLARFIFILGGPVCLYTASVVPSAFLLLGLCLIISSMWCWYLLSFIYAPAGDSLYSYFLFCRPASFLGATWTFLCLLITHYIGVKCFIVR